jgi:hypothetical protein
VNGSSSRKKPQRKGDRRDVPGVVRSAGKREIAQMSLNEFAKTYERPSWGFTRDEFEVWEGDSLVLSLRVTPKNDSVISALIMFIEREREMVALLRRRIAGPKESGAVRPPVLKEIVLLAAVRLVQRGIKRDRHFNSAVHGKALMEIARRRVDVDFNDRIRAKVEPLSKRYVRDVMNESLADQGKASMEIALAKALNRARSSPRQK